jgi:NADH-quinone oxidoreductase subunit N
MAPHLATISGGLRPLSILALVLILAGLSFRVGIVPFHFYAPDVYQGTTASNAALLAVIPKIAGLVALVRIVTLAMPGIDTIAWRLALVLAVFTMTLGRTMSAVCWRIRRSLMAATC